MIGRNERCPCGSKRKYRKCCLLKERVPIEPRKPPPEVIAKALMEMARRAQAREDWTKRYGHVRPCISTDNWGKKIIATGKRVHFAEKCKYIPDFLLQYIPTLFGKDWWDTEVAKPDDQRHQIFKWRVGCLRHRARAQEDAPGRLAIAADGNSAAYLSLAFNLFAIEDNGRLDDTLLQRLKHPDQFQGAWHEVFVEATCLRAGFAIEREDERDPATRHAEFTATHKATGERFSVEAKSKHRPGVLGFPGAAQPEERLSLAFGRLINDAIAKRPQHPLVIFMDTNLPLRAATRVYGPQGEAVEPSPYIRVLLDRIRTAHGGSYPFVMLALTNIPHHYVAAHEPDPPKQIHMMMTENPATNRGRALNALYEAVPLYGNIPNEFPDF
jgi:SEC-C motif